VNDCFRRSALLSRAAGSGRELPSWLIIAPFHEVECLAASDDQMIEGADFHQLQGLALWTGVCNRKGATPISFFRTVWIVLRVISLTAQAFNIPIGAHRPSLLIQDRMLTSISMREKVQQLP